MMFLNLNKAIEKVKDLTPIQVDGVNQIVNGKGELVKPYEANLLLINSVKILLNERKEITIWSLIKQVFKHS